MYRNTLMTCLIILTVLLFGCSGSVSDYTLIDRKPQIDPDYSGITIPPNVAPLNFTINEKADKYRIELHHLYGDGFVIKSTDNTVSIKTGKWKRLLERCKGKDFSVDILIKQAGTCKKFQTINNHVASDPIERFLVYRLFDQGFEIWNQTGIYQRCLENYDESPIIVNSISEGNCVNCHAFRYAWLYQIN
jgi:hypothetical protein